MRLNPHQQICKYWAKWNKCPAITFGAHSIWEEEDSGTHWWGREPHGKSASGQPALREGWSQPGVVVQCLGTCWVMIVLQVPPATAPLTWLAKQTSEIILWLPLYHFESCWKQVCVLVTSWIHALVANAPGWPQGPPHTIWPISTLPLFCLHFHVCTSLNISGVDYLSVVLLHGRDSSLLHFWAQLHVSGWWNDI